MSLEKKGLRCIGFARSATDEQGHGSIEKQVMAIHKYAKRNGYEVIENIVLKGVSGANTLQHLLQLVKRKVERNDFDCVIAYDLSRYSREWRSMWLTYWEFNAVGVELLTVASDSLTSIGRTGDVEVGVQRFAANNCSRHLSLTTKEGLRHAVATGRIPHVSTPPLGVERLHQSHDGTPLYFIRKLADGSIHRVDATTGAATRLPRVRGKFVRTRPGPDERVTLVPGDAEHVALVRQVLRRRFIDGWTLKAILNELRDGQGTAVKGLTLASLRRICQNPVYLGVGMGRIVSTSSPTAKWYFVQYPALAKAFVPDDIREKVLATMMDRLPGLGLSFCRYRHPRETRAGGVGGFEPGHHPENNSGQETPHYGDEDVPPNDTGRGG